MTYLIIGFITGGILGAVTLYFVLKSSMISRNSYDELNNLYIKNNSDLENSNTKIQELNQTINEEKELNQQQLDFLNDIKKELTEVSTKHSYLNNELLEQKETNSKQTSQIDNLLIEKFDILSKNSNLVAKNENLQKLLETQKEEITKIQENAKLQFKNLANEILEEKTTKFTQLNRENLDNILKPLGENLESLKKELMKFMKTKREKGFL